MENNIIQYFNNNCATLNKQLIIQYYAIIEKYNVINNFTKIYELTGIINNDDDNIITIIKNIKLLTKIIFGDNNIVNTFITKSINIININIIKKLSIKNYNIIHTYINQLLNIINDINKCIKNNNDIEFNKILVIMEYHNEKLVESYKKFTMINHFGSNIFKSLDSNNFFDGTKIEIIDNINNITNLINNDNISNIFPKYSNSGYLCVMLNKEFKLISSFIFTSLYDSNDIICIKEYVDQLLIFLNWAIDMEINKRLPKVIYGSEKETFVKMLCKRNIKRNCNDIKLLHKNIITKCSINNISDDLPKFPIHQIYEPTFIKSIENIIKVTEIDNIEYIYGSIKNDITCLYSNINKEFNDILFGVKKNMYNKEDINDIIIYIDIIRDFIKYLVNKSIKHLLNSKIYDEIEFVDYDSTLKNLCKKIIIVNRCVFGFESVLTSFNFHQNDKMDNVINIIKKIKYITNNNNIIQILDDINKGIIKKVYNDIYIDHIYEYLVLLHEHLNNIIDKNIMEYINDHKQEILDDKFTEIIEMTNECNSKNLIRIHKWILCMIEINKNKLVNNKYIIVNSDKDKNNNLLMIEYIKQLIKEKNIYVFNELGENTNYTYLYVDEIMDKIRRINNSGILYEVEHKLIRRYMNEIIEYMTNKKCNIIEIYMKYSRLIHLLVSIKNPLLTETQGKDMYDNINDLDNNILSTRCFASVNIFNNLMGGDYAVGISSKLEDIKRVLEEHKNVPLYYIIIFVKPHGYMNGTIKYSYLNHTFAIIKNGNKYYILQSYIHKVCPTIKKYKHKEIILLLDEIYSIYDDKKKDYTNRWTVMDNIIWNKYFLADERELIGHSEINDLPIKFSSVFMSCKVNMIKMNECYKNIANLVTNMYDCVRYNILFYTKCILKIFGLNINDYDRIINEIINTTKFVTVIKSNDNTINITLQDNIYKICGEYKNDINKSIIYENTKDKWIKLFDDLSFNETSIDLDTLFSSKYPINNVNEVCHFLNILIDFFGLYREVMVKNTCGISLESLVIHQKLYNKYIKYKKKYVALKML